MSEHPHFALRSQRVIVGDEMIPACVEIKNQLIHAIHPYDVDFNAREDDGSLIEDCLIEDLGNKVLMAGLVDSHVHINEPGRTEWEGFNTATQAAAAGGITTLVDMPLNCIPVTITKAAFTEKLAAVDDKLWVDCGFWGGVVPHNLDDLDELLTAGVLGAKSFLIDSGIAEFPPVAEQDIAQALPILAKHNVPYLIHAELDCQHGAAANKSTVANITDKYQSFLNSRPKQWENDAVALMVKAAKEAKIKGHDAKVHIVHLSSAQALASIKQAKAQGLQFTAETCPHYLTLASENIPDGKTLFKCCPPIREQENQDKLWQALNDEIISFIVSDHSPCTPQLKHIDSGDLEKAWGGISALQFGLPLIWTEAKKRGFSLVDISRLMSFETAEFAGLSKIKGQIVPGRHADLCVFDDECEYQISTEMIKHKYKITPYVGKTVCGKILQTYLRGKLIYCDDEFIDLPQGKPLLKGQF